MNLRLPDGPIRIAAEAIGWMTTRVYAPPEYRGWPWYSPRFAIWAAVGAYRARKVLAGIQREHGLHVTYPSP